MSERYDAVVIGAGIIGAAVALELSRRGHRTLGVDRLPASGYGSTSNSCAIIRTHYSTVEGAALAYEGYFYWKHWREYLGVDDERGLAEFHESGCLVMKTDVNGHLATIIENMDKLGIPYEEWTPEQIRARLTIYDLRRFAPAKRLDDDAFAEPTGGELTGGVMFPTAGYISDPQLATHNIQRAAEALGATFRFNAEVSQIPSEAGKVGGVVLSDGTRIEAPVVVNVAGPHSSKINRLAGAHEDMKITTRALRQEVVHVPSPEGFDYERDGLVVSDSDISCYNRPETGNHILVGSEDPPCDEREFVDPDDFNRDFTEQWTVQAYRMAQRAPGLGIPSTMRGVVDLYDVTEDSIPIYDRSSIDGYYMAIGTSGNQFKNAPVAGVLMAELIAACQAGRDHDAEPVTVALKHTGLEADLRFYSRLREINADSSFSVLG